LRPSLLAAHQGDKPAVAKALAAVKSFAVLMNIRAMIDQERWSVCL
jgi:hypothetical protein